MSEANEMPEAERGEEQAGAERGGLGLKRMGIIAAVAAIIFLLGFVPSWLSAKENAGQRDAARRELRLARLENSLGFAAISARRGQYEPARQAASEFFTALRQELDSGNDSALTAEQRAGLSGLLDSRDETITLLARADPAGADRLSDLYLAFHERVGTAQTRGHAATPEKVSVMPAG